MKGIKTYYTLKEVYSHVAGEEYVAYGSNETLYDCFGTNYPKCPLWIEDESHHLVSKDYLEELWILILARYYNHYCCDGDELIPSANEFSIRLLNSLVMTYDRYAPQLNFYSSYKDKLMDKIQNLSENIARFNDTPQNEESSDEFEDHDHTTNISKSKNKLEMDYGTNMSRLDEITSKIRNVYEDWLNELDELFIEEENI